VQENYVRERAISFYADRLCVTPKYLSQVVKQISGRLAGEWISDYVILEAKALINSHKYTMQQISDMLNFANQSFFAKYFKEKAGCTPSSYLNS
jgi:AraC-like DNA-binding protein